MLGRPASEKRRGTKSREVGAPSVPRALWGFGPRHQVGRGCIKAPPVAFRAGWVWVTGWNEYGGRCPTGSAVRLRADLSTCSKRGLCWPRASRNGELHWAGGSVVTVS
jgi:hypothetical protein